MADIHLARITVYPIKSFDGVDVTEAEVLSNGAIAGDRRFALFDADGRTVNGKRTPAIHRIRSEYNLNDMTVRLHEIGSDRAEQFSLIHDQIDLGRWFSEALDVECRLAENTTGGFPDDTDAPGPTVLGSGSLTAVAGWFPGVTVAETWRRFRANLLISPVPAFWEDHYVGTTAEEYPYWIKIDSTEWLGTGVCQRCPVPTRASETGEVTPLFQKTFATRREESLPSWSPRQRFDHFYRLAINTRLAPGGTPGVIRVGSPIAATLGETLL